MALILATIVVAPFYSSYSLWEVFRSLDWSPMLFIIGLSFSIWVLSSIVLEHQFGRTLGKLIFRLRLVAVEGGALTLGRAVRHNLGKVVELSVPFLLESNLLNPSKKGISIGNRWAKSRTIHA